MGIGQSNLTYNDICELEDTLYHGHPEDVIDMIRKQPLLARVSLSEDPWNRGALPVYSFLEMGSVKLHHLKTLESLINGKFPSRLLHFACSKGCDPDIIVYLSKRNPRAARTKDVHGNLPFYNLLGSGTSKHLIPLEMLLSLSSAQVKKDVQKFYIQARSNQECPQAILHKLIDMGEQNKL